MEVLPLLPCLSAPQYYLHLFPSKGHSDFCSHPEESRTFQKRDTKGGVVLVFLTSRAQDSRGLPGTAKGPS